MVGFYVEIDHSCSIICNITSHVITWFVWKEIGFSARSLFKWVLKLWLWCGLQWTIQKHPYCWRFYRTTWFKMLRKKIPNNSPEWFQSIKNYAENLFTIAIWDKNILENYRFCTCFIEPHENLHFNGDIRKIYYPNVINCELQFALHRHLCLFV